MILLCSAWFIFVERLLKLGKVIAQQRETLLCNNYWDSIIRKYSAFISHLTDLDKSVPDMNPQTVAIGKDKHLLDRRKDAKGDLPILYQSKTCLEKNCPCYGWARWKENLWKISSMNKIKENTKQVYSAKKTVIRRGSWHNKCLLENIKNRKMQEFSVLACLW